MFSGLFILRAPAARAAPSSRCLRAGGVVVGLSFRVITQCYFDNKMFTKRQLPTPPTKLASQGTPQQESSSSVGAVPVLDLRSHYQHYPHTLPYTPHRGCMVVYGGR